MISSLAIIPKGAARARPVRFELGEEEYRRITELAEEEAAEECAQQNALEEDDEGDEEGGILGLEAINDEQEEFEVRCIAYVPRLAITLCILYRLWSKVVWL